MQWCSDGAPRRERSRRWCRAARRCRRFRPGESSRPAVSYGGARVRRLVHENRHAERSIRELELAEWLPSREQRERDRRRAAERAGRRLARHSLVLLGVLARPWRGLKPSELALRWALEHRDTALAWRAFAEVAAPQKRR